MRIVESQKEHGMPNVLVARGNCGPGGRGLNDKQRVDLDHQMGCVLTGHR